MASINNTPRPAYVYDTATNEWIPIGVGAHSHNEIPKTVVDAKGDLIVGTANDTVDRLAVGTNGQVLTADSTAATGLKWGLQGLTLISRATVSAQTTLTFDNVFSSTYDSYLIVVEDMYAVTGTDDLLFQYRYAGPATQTAAYYGSCGSLQRTGTTWTNTASTNAASMSLVPDLGAAGSGISSGYIWVNQVGNASERPSLKGEFFGGQSFDLVVVACGNDVQRTYTGFILSCASNITGTVAVYGLAK